MARIQQLEPRLVLSGSPVAAISGPSIALPGEQVTFSASQSSDPDGDSLSYEWDVDGDGVFSEGSTVAVSLDPSSYGTITYGTPRAVKVRAIDTENLSSVASMQLRDPSPQ